VFVSDRDGERMRVLGVDPGLTRAAIGRHRRNAGRALTLVATDVICNPAGDDTPRLLCAGAKASNAG